MVAAALEERAAYGIGWRRNTPPWLGCCKVTEGSCGGNLLKMRRLTTKQTAGCSCSSNLRLAVGEPVEITRQQPRTGIPARSRACSLHSAVRKGSPLRSDRFRSMSAAISHQRLVNNCCRLAEALSKDFHHQHAHNAERETVLERDFIPNRRAVAGVRLHLHSLPASPCAAAYGRLDSWH